MFIILNKETHLLDILISTLIGELIAGLLAYVVLKMWLYVGGSNVRQTSD